MVCYDNEKGHPHGCPFFVVFSNALSMKHKILFVCHGNICRGPMAEFVMFGISNQDKICEVLILV